MIDNDIPGTLQEAMAEDFPELVNVIIQDSESLPNNLPTSVAVGDSKKKVCCMVHNLKSTSANCGIMHYSEIYANLEYQADIGDLSTATSQIDGLKKEIWLCT